MASPALTALLGAHAAAGGSFSPSDISGLKGWWDASDAGSIHATGSSVDTWDDLSATGADFTSSGGARFSTGTRTQNGLNVLAMTTSKLMTTTLTVSQPFTILAVWVCDDTLAGSYHALLGPNGSGLYAGLRIATSWINVGSELYGGSFASAGTFCQTTWIGNGSSSEVYGDGANSGTGNAGTTGLSAFRINGDASNSNMINGAIGELIVYDSALGSTDRATVEDYLSAKWGTP